MPIQNQTQGLFSANTGEIVNQEFFDAAFAGRLYNDPIYKEAYNCNVLNQCSMGTWLDEYMGWETSCNPAYSVIENSAYNQQVRNLAAVIVPAASGTVTFSLDPANFYVSGQFILPQVGNTLVAHNGALLDITAVSVTAANTGTVTVRNRNADQASFTIPAGTDMLVLAGSALLDCECPVGQFAFPDLPIIHDLEMIAFGDKGELCGDALLKCQYLKIPFTDDCGNVFSKWYTGALQEMYRRHEMRKYMERLLNPVFGIIPVLRTRGQNFTRALTTETTLADVEAWKQEITEAGFYCNEYAIFAGSEKYAQWQRLLHELGVAQLAYTPFKEGECKWINMEYCGIKIGGLTLHIYEDCFFSNGQALGGANSPFPNAEIWIPLCDRTTNCRGGSDNNKMFTTVYFKDNAGRVHDNLTDSNGVLGVRNTFGAGCDNQEWTIKSRFTQEIHCPNMWGHSGLI